MENWKKLMFECLDCHLVFEIYLESGRYTIRKAYELACPKCQNPVIALASLPLRDAKYAVQTIVRNYL